MIELRELKVEDAKRLLELIKDKKVLFGLGNPHVTFETLTLEKEIAFIKIMCQDIKNKKDLVFEIVVDGEIIGVVGTKGIDYKKSEVEFGYWIGKDYWGKGYVTEAVKLFVERFFEEFDINRLYAIAYSNNPASSKVLEKNGFTKYDEKEATHLITKEKVIDFYYELKRS